MNIENESVSGKLLVEGTTVDSLVERIANRTAEIMRSGQAAPSTKTSELIDRRTAAKYLNVSLPTLDRMVKDKKVRSYKVGKHRRFRVQELEAYLTVVND